MPLREDNPGSGLQVAFEDNRASLVRELEDNVNGPRTVLRGVNTATRVVLGISFRNVRVSPV